MDKRWLCVPCVVGLVVAGWLLDRNCAAAGQDEDRDEGEDARGVGHSGKDSRRSSVVPAEHVDQVSCESRAL